MRAQRPGEKDQGFATRNGPMKEKLINTSLFIGTVIFTLLALEIGLRAYHGEWEFTNFRFPQANKFVGYTRNFGISGASAAAALATIVAIYGVSVETIIGWVFAMIPAMVPFSQEARVGLANVGLLGAIGFWAVWSYCWATVMALSSRPSISSPGLTPPR